MPRFSYPRHVYLSILVLFFQPSFGQVADIGIDFQRNGYIRALSKGAREAVVDFIDKKGIETTPIKIASEVDLAPLKAGLSVSLKGEYFRKSDSYKITAIKPAKNYEQKIKITKGRLDFISNDFAIIEGQLVRLKPGATIKGRNGYNKDFTKLTDLMLGDIVNLSGTWQSDGFIYTDSFTVEPDQETDEDREVKKAGLELRDMLYAAWGNKSKRREYLGKQIDGIQICEDDRLQEFVNMVGQRLIPDHAKSKLKFVFVVVNDNEFNACVIPNGLSLVNTGLFKHVRNEAQLAAVLGHEIAHAMYEHGAKREKDLSNALKKKEKLYESKKMIALLGKIVPEKEALNKMKSGVLVNELPMSIIQRELADYSVEEEAQADRVGLYLLTRAGYDPREASLVWKAVFNEEGDGKAKKNAYVDKLIDDMLANDRGASKNMGELVLSSVARTKTSNNVFLSKRTHPYNSDRYENLLTMTYLFWSSDELLKKSKRGLLFR